jgi:Uri superfamily endonuclease
MRPFTHMNRDNRIPSDPGAYALVIRLRREFDAPVGALGTIHLAPGCYVYLGSANGPGGIAARVRRHLRADKRMHWHIDRLTGAGAISDIAAQPGGSECALVDHLMTVAGIDVPVAGFGSSDCRQCRAHLLSAAGSNITGPKIILNRLRQLYNMQLYSAASLISSAATDPAIV